MHLSNKGLTQACKPGRQVQCRPLLSVSTTLQSPSTEVIDSATLAKMAEMTRRFQTADTDGNGSIDREELRQVLESTEGGDAVMFTEHWLPEEELDRAMQLYDKDHNGVIDFEEFKQIVYDGLLLDGKLSEYEAAFKAIDSSGNGTIGATELASLFSSLGNPMSYERLVEVMQRYDKDESGQIDFNEFLMMFRNHLLDLRAVQRYMAGVEADRAASGALLDLPEGGAYPLIFSEQELNEVIQTSQKAGKLLVVFNALTWCRPCRGMQRPAQRLAEAYKDTVNWVKIFGNSNTSTKLMFKDRFKIRSTPSFVVIFDDKVVYTYTGNNKGKLEAGLREQVAKYVAASKLPANVIYPPDQE